MVTRETDPHRSGRRSCAWPPGAPTNVGQSVFRDLATNEAALLPGSEESQGQVRRFQLGATSDRTRSASGKVPRHAGLRSPGLRVHQRGRHGPRAHTLKEFMGLLAALPSDRIRAHLLRHDFSRWLADVFRDNPLAAHVREIEGARL